MLSETSAEPVANLPVAATVSAQDTTKPISPVADGGGEDTTPMWEYEFSTYSQGRVMFIGMWDKSDVSACERLLHRPIKSEEITYSETGNGFVVDEYGNRFTFQRKPYFRTVEWPDLGDMIADSKPAKQESAKPVSPPKATIMSVEELLAGL